MTSSFRPHFGPGVDSASSAHIPVFDRPARDRTGERTTLNFNNIFGSNLPVERPRTLRPSSRCMRSDLQRIVIHLLLCSCCTAVVSVDITGRIGFKQ